LADMLRCQVPVPGAREQEAIGDALSRTEGIRRLHTLRERRGQRPTLCGPRRWPTRIRASG
ncbi:hypothetical protein, partial [Mycolicibacterium moriokaense]|uniref:hypothetical protein n=1 Tax=Mycolicibacterium moriokaense TaxID=39691 RepID=UPI001A99F55C